MTQPFILKLTDNINTIDFLSSSVKVEDGGFDISIPQAKRTIGMVRPGFYSPVSTFYEYRTAKLRFNIYGGTRDDIIGTLHKIERILLNISSRAQIAGTHQGELSYAWSGSNNITYFEVYGGDITFPSDVLSVAKIHALTSGGKMMLPEVEIVLQLSPMGYGVSIYAEATQEVPLYNPSVGSKRTGGVNVQNIRMLPTEQYNYVEIDGADLPGSQPLITKLMLSTGASNYIRWSAMFMGVQHAPYPTKLVFDTGNVVHTFIGGSAVNDSAAENGQYHSVSLSSNFSHNFFSTMAWSVDSNSVGRFFGFLHGGTSFPVGCSFALGVDDYVTYGIRFHEDYVVPMAGCSTAALGSIQLPPTDLALANYGTIHPDLWMGIWFMYSGSLGATFTHDALSLMPITNGLRILKSRVASSTAGDYIDDGWKGIEYFKSSDGKVYNPFYGVLEPLKLTPATTQRLYFTTIGDVPISYEKTRTLSVRLFIVPTYLTLAL